MEKEGHTIKVISPNDFTTLPMPFYPEIRLALFPYKKMVKIISNFEPDRIVIPVEGPLGWAARRYCLKHKKPFATAFHTHFPEYAAKRMPSFLGPLIQSIGIYLVKIFHTPSKTVFVATQSLENQLKEWGFQNQFVRLVRGVDTSIFYPSKKKKSTKNRTLLYVGRVSVEKNIEAFLDIDIDAHKIVVGTGPDLERLQKQYPKVEFAGLRQGQELGDYYRRADCFVFPSKTDTFGIVLIEAMACGLPVAAYPVTGPIDLITEDFMGVLDDDLKEAVIKALKLPCEAQKRHDYAKDKYSWAKVARVFASSC